jgi:hypothetical protein
MLSNFFRRLSDRKQRVNKKQNIETEIAASSGGQGKIMTYVGLTWPSLGAAITVFKISLLVKRIFGITINRNKEECYQPQIINFTKNVCLEMIHSEGQ